MLPKSLDTCENNNNNIQDFNDPSNNNNLYGNKNHCWDSRGDNFLEPYMQGLGTNHTDYNTGFDSSTIDTSSYASEDIRTSNFHRKSETVGGIYSPNQNSSYHDNLKTIDKNGYSDNFFNSIELSKKNSISKNSNEDRLISLKEIEILANQNKEHLQAILKLTNQNELTNDVIKNLTNDDLTRTSEFFINASKVRDIVSTSRSGHLIERRNACKIGSSEEDVSADPATGGDSSDKDERDGPTGFKLEDVNDNGSDGTLSQRDDDLTSSEGTGSENSDCDAPCGIGLMERLIRSHPVWFLPGIQRAGAVHLLQGKEEGNFVVRQSSQPDTMAISVRLPTGKGPYIEHYLIQAVDGQLSLESSDNTFESIPSLIAHYSQCCDELPVQLTLPRTIREAKNRQQLSSFALLGQEFWRYPMANPRPPEANNHSPNSSHSGSLSSFGSVNNSAAVKNSNSEITLDLVPFHHDSQPPSLLSTFKGTPTENTPPMPPERERPPRPNTLDLICTNTVSGEIALNKSSPNTDKTLSITGGKTPPPPPPRWAKPSPAVTGSQGQVSITTTVTFNMNEVQVSCVQLTPTQQKNSSAESDREPSTTSLNLSSPSSDQSVSLSKSFDQNISSPHSDQTNFKSVNYEKENASIRHFQHENRLQQLVSPISDKTNLVSKSFERIQSNRSPVSTPTDKFGRSGKRHRKDSKTKESRHYKECDILERHPYYRSSAADKQSDYEDIWGNEPLSTFKPVKSPQMDVENWKTEEKPEFKRTPDLLEKLEKSSPLTPLYDDRKDRNRLNLHVNTQSTFQSYVKNTVMEIEQQSEQKQNSSPFYAEPADAIVVNRRKMKPVFSKTRHSDPSFFNNWSTTTNPYLSGGNILERIDSQGDVNEEQPPKAKPSLSVDNIVALKNKESESKFKGIQKGKNVVKGKPVQPPKVGIRALGKTDQSWAVDSSWEFIGNDDNEEKEAERRFPSIEQQMDSEDAERICTVQQIIAQRFPQFKISPMITTSEEGNSKSKGNGVSTSDLQFQKGNYNTSASRVSAYDNIEQNYGVKTNSDGKCDKKFLDGINGVELRTNRSDTLRSKIQNSDSIQCKNPYNTDSMRSRRFFDSGSIIDDNEDTQTIFSEPWDSSRWENLLLEPNSCNWDENGSESTIRIGGEPILNTDDDDTVMETPKKPRPVSRGKSFKERLDPLLSPPRLQALRSKELTGTGSTIRSYALHLASDKSTTFAQNIDNFIACTLESKETNPQVVMRNMRQFMSGMKNYLVKHGEREFEKQVEKERMKLKATEFLNLDAILEGVMHKLVVRPLKEHLYKLFVDEYTRNGAIQLLHENINYARTKPLYDLGIKSKISPPSEKSLETICHFILRLQEVDSPLEKLDHLLTCIAAIFNSVKSSNQGKTAITLGADDFLPLFVWVLVQSGFIAAEIEAEYMWGLLHPSLLSGEGGYYLTTLSSAVHVLKNFKSCDMDPSNGLSSTDWNCGDLRSVLKIVVPDEMHGSILTKTLPVRPNMTTKDVCKIIAHKVRITNPQDYGLFKLVDGEETLLNDTDCPQDIKCNVTESGKHCMLAYKRIDAKIAWPRT